ncbi:MAG: hypothetical protein K0B15_01655 [Lentimicrobium sp.]|nr:hypothetical protein [Lentimicrobium sp.]
MKAVHFFNLNEKYFSKEMRTLLPSQLTEADSKILSFATISLVSIVFWLVLIFSLFAGQKIHAQDTLFLRDGSYRLVRDITITGNLLKFYDYNEIGGPLNVVLKCDYQMIAYCDGNKTYFEEYQIPVKIIPEKSEAIEYSFGRHVLSLNVIDLFYRSLTVNYEFFTPLRNLSYRVPVSIGLNPRRLSGYERSLHYRNIQVNYPVNKIYSLGVDLSYYPGKLSQVRFFTGLGLEIGQHYKHYQYYDIHVYDVNEFWKETSFSVLAQSGAMFHMSERLVMTGNVDIGFINLYRPYIRYGIAIGTSFKKNNHENKQK